MDKPNEPEYLVVKEVARIMRVDPSTVRRWINRGSLPAVRIDSTIRIDKEALRMLQGRRR